MNRSLTFRILSAWSAALWWLAAPGTGWAGSVLSASLERTLPARVAESTEVGRSGGPNTGGLLQYAQASPGAVGRSVALGTQVALAIDELWLATLHPGSPTNVQPRLVEILTNETGRSLLLRQKAAVALGVVGRPTVATIKAVQRRLPEEPEPMQLSLLWLVSGWSTEALDVLPQVLEQRANSSVSVRFLAGLAERRLIGGPILLSSEANSIVRGHAMHVARNRPGDFTGRAGVWLPATPAPGASVYFLGTTGLHEAVANAEGLYEIRLPAGRYDVATLSRAPDLSQPAVELLVQRTAGGDLQPVEVQRGQTLDMDPAATAAYPD